MVFKFLEGFDNYIRILLEVNEHGLIFFDTLELPVCTGKNEVKVKLSVTGQLDFDTFANTMKLND